MNLKQLYDAAKDADGKAQLILKQMTDAFDTGTEEGKQKALELRPALDEAKLKANEANQLYISARDADAVDVNSASRRFVPTGGVVNTTREITRAEFEEMDYAERHTYLQSGGAIVSNPE